MFDSNNLKWTYRQTVESFKSNWFTRALAKTFYNPTLDAKVIWTSKGIYSIDELKEKINDCVDNDDDIITQFEEGDVIKSAVVRSSTIDEIIQVLNKYVFDVNEEELWKEQEERHK